MKNFADRHIGMNNKDKSKMLEFIDSKSIEQLISETIPNNIRLKKEMNLKPALSENDYLSHIEKLGKKNKIYKSYIGLGYNQSIVPSVIKRNILENPSWYTAYTPYQAEIAQGRMEALLNYQTIICDLTGMELANASLLDESTAAAEAMTMLFSLRNREQKKNNISRFFVSKNTLPQTISLLETRAEPLGIQIQIGDFEQFQYDSSFYGCLMQYPGVYGGIEDVKGYCSKAKNNNIKIVRLQSGEDIMADVMENDENELIVLDNPMHIIFKRMPTGQTVMMMMPWLPIEIIKENNATIYGTDILTVIEPKDDLIEYYGRAVLEAQDIMEKKRIRGINDDDFDEEDEDDDEEELQVEDIIDLMREKKNKRLH